MSILVLADIHGNLNALQKVLQDAAGEYEEIWVLGDIAGYGPDPGPCLDILINAGAIMVAGNHDWAACGKISSDDFNPDARAAIELHRSILSNQHKHILEQLPELIIRRSVTLTHGNPMNPIWGYVLDDGMAAWVLARAETSLTLVGHSHFPLLWALKPNGIRQIPCPPGTQFNYSGSLHLANPGSVGQSRDGNPAARYMLLDPVRKTMEFRYSKWKRGPLRRKMASRGYSQSLIRKMVCTNQGRKNA